ncbi:hypothetical protein MKX01_031027 [Papaver californicum]|nr:hypothetical protein MKX01_031027 [Papaver californicum]
MYMNMGLLLAAWNSSTMAKLRDRELETSENRSDDDFENVSKKKRKTRVPKSFKDRGKAPTSKGKKTETMKLFRANLGPLHDLFRDIEERGHTLNSDQLGALRSTWSMLQVFVNNKINKGELSKNNHGLEMLLKSYTKAKDGNCGFKFGIGSRLFVSTPVYMAVIFGMQLIENGIENKILNERHIIPSTSDLCQKYKFEAGLLVLRSTEAYYILYVSNHFFSTKTGNFSLPRNYLVFVKSIDVINRISWPHLIHNAMMENIHSSVGDVNLIIECSFYLLFEKISFAHKSKIPLDWVKERKLVTPIKQQSRMEKMEIRVINLDKKNVALTVEKEKKEEVFRKLRGFQMRLRSEKNRLRAKGKREKVDVMPEIFDLMETTLEHIFKNLESKKEDRLQEHDELPQGREAPQVDDDEAHEEYGCKTPDTLPQLPHTENGIHINSATSGPVFSLGLTQFFNEYEKSGQIHYHGGVDPGTTNNGVTELENQKEIQK